jgi:hypothetical protein
VDSTGIMRRRSFSIGVKYITILSRILHWTSEEPFYLLNTGASLRMTAFGARRDEWCAPQSICTVSD